MKEAEYKKICAAYRKKFTTEQILQMAERNRLRLLTGELFKFGPVDQKVNVRFVKMSTCVDLMLVRIDYPEVSICSWNNFIGVNEIEVTKDMLDLVAVWDLTMKQYYIDLARKMGMDP